MENIILTNNITSHIVDGRKEAPTWQISICECNWLTRKGIRFLRAGRGIDGAVEGLLEWSKSYISLFL